MIFFFYYQLIKDKLSLIIGKQINLCETQAFGKNDTDLEITQVILMQLHVFMNFKLNRPIHLNSPRDNWGVEVRDYHV